VLVGIYIHIGCCFNRCGCRLVEPELVYILERHDTTNMGSSRLETSEILMVRELKETTFLESTAQAAM
jgi:hypothetical protein